MNVWFADNSDKVDSKYQKLLNESIIFLNIKFIIEDKVL